MAGFEGDAEEPENAAEPLKTERECIYEGNAPSGGWSLCISAPTQVAPHFYAGFRNDALPAYFGFPFGYNAPLKALEVRWNLPNNVCGLYLDGSCYALLMYGHLKWRRKRVRYSDKKPFNYDSIAWFCNEHSKIAG